jgi:hypothetical protein
VPGEGVVAEAVQGDRPYATIFRIRAVDRQVPLREANILLNILAGPPARPRVPASAVATVHLHQEIRRLTSHPATRR